MVWETILASSISGAIAGGVVGLISQFLAHKWKREEALFNEKRLLYSKIVSFGAFASEDKNQESLNECVSAALLICSEELHIKLCDYMVVVTSGGTKSELADAHFEMTEVMKKELSNK